MYCETFCAEDPVDEFASAPALKSRKMSGKAIASAMRAPSVSVTDVFAMTGSSV